MTIAHSVFTSSFHLCSCGKVTTTPLLIFHELHRIIIYALFGDITAASSRSLHGSQGISYDFFEKVRYTIFRNRTLQSKAFQKIAPSSAPSLPNSHCAIDFFESLAQTSSPSSPPPESHAPVTAFGRNHDATLALLPSFLHLPHDIHLPHNGVYN